MSPPPPPPIRIASCVALLAGRTALTALPVQGHAGGDLVPLALIPGRPYDDPPSPAWLPTLQTLATRIPSPQPSGLRSQVSGLTPQPSWGHPRYPVFVTGSNFGVGHLLAFRQHRDPAHLAFGTPHACVRHVAQTLGWGPDVTVLSHACVSAHLGLLQATRLRHADLADEALVFSFDFISAFVAGGFHALKILNADFPAPYQDRPNGSIGLGDGAAFAVLSRHRGDFALSGQSLHNEMHHFTANRADGTGFAACLAPLPAAAAGRRVWLKGHGTGTLEAGRLEATALDQAFPHAPLVSWKGALGHTLGSCGLVELALTLAALRLGRAPGTVGTHAPAFTPAVTFSPFDLASFDGVVCTSNAFGGAHAAFLTHHA